MHPSFQEANRLLNLFHALVADGFTPATDLALPADRGARLEVLRRELEEAIRRCGRPAEAARVAAQVTGAVEELRSGVAEDVDAALMQDPAARSREEVEACYPGVFAVSAYRFAHRVLRAGVPILPRMLTELAHSQTGIDINPGARIGRSFFIDHGTGVVVGETTDIGDRVTLYQGVTLGALNFPRDPSGRVLRIEKRHPTVEDDVTIYSNATILGGDTVIGRGCVIGANVILTESVPPGTVVTQQPPRLLHMNRELPRP